MKRIHPQLEAQHGFTLIELSIVLVIIGLIVGGVLVGQDLIRAAEVRATVSQYEKYNTAINTFRTKYNGIPGDVPSPGTYGLYGAGAQGMAGTAGLGDGNGLIEETGGAGGTDGRGETLVFWRHLTDANLIDGNYGATLANGGLSGDVALGFPASELPPAKLGGGNYFIVYSTAGLNYYQIIGTSDIVPATGVYAYNATSMTPLESYNIDNKVDDGAPNTGTVLARAINSINGAATYDNAAPVTGACTTGGAGAGTPSAVYVRDINDGGNNSAACSLRLRHN